MSTAEIPYGCYWSTPFAKWQGALQHLNAVQFGAWVTQREMEKRQIDPAIIDHGILGITVSAEKEVIYIVVPADQADRIFEKIYVAANMDTPGMGMVYMTPLEKMATYVPPEIVDRFGR